MLGGHVSGNAGLYRKRLLNPDPVILNIDRNTARLILSGETSPTLEILTALEKAATQPPDRSV